MTKKKNDMRVVLFKRERHACRSYDTMAIERSMGRNIVISRKERHACRSFLKSTTRVLFCFTIMMQQIVIIDNTKPTYITLTLF